MNKITKLLENITPEPWVWEPQRGSVRDRLLSASGKEIMNFGDSEQYYPTEGEPPEDNDAAFIAQSPTLLRELNDHAQAMKGLLKVIREVGYFRTEIDARLAAFDAWEKENG